MKKVMILADSCALPRGFPEESRTAFEETYPYLLQKQLPDATFYQFCMGGISTPDLLGQAIAYFDRWEPEIIVVQVGIVDCRPEPVSNFLRVMLNEFTFLQRFKLLIYKPSVMKRLIKLKTRSRLTPNQYKRNIKKLQSVFPDSKIFWMEISTTASGGYEEHRPGVLARIAEFNSVIKSALPDGFVPVHDKLSAANGISADHLHFNRAGHAIVFETLKTRIDSFYANRSK
jgi:hypothetical protein